ncbi:MAG TPA: cupin domain-containing protein [Candidatus Acidoferrum sp.]
MSKKQKALIFVLVFGCAAFFVDSNQVRGQETAKKSAAAKAGAAEAKPGAQTAKAAAGTEPFIGTPDKIKWVQYSPGVEFGPVHGNCDKPGAPCVFQLRFAEGAKFPPHWHPVDENVTVISGTFGAGMGDAFDESKMVTLPAGSYVLMPKRMHHFALAKTATLVQVHGVGPFKINYVNPADDPSKAAKAGD